MGIVVTNALSFLRRRGTLLGALIDGLIFSAMLAFWYFSEGSPPGARNADSGSMGLLLPFVIAFTLLFCALLAAGSSLLGAFAGYWAARTRSPFLGSLSGLLAGAICAGLLAVVFPASAGSSNVFDAWFSNVKWLAPPAIVAGFIVGFVEWRRGKQSEDHS